MPTSLTGTLLAVICRTNTGYEELLNEKAIAREDVLNGFVILIPEFSEPKAQKLSEATGTFVTGSKSILSVHFFP